MAAETTDKNISLKNVRDFLYDVRLKWYDFGIELDIPHQELDRIKAANKDDHGVCLRDMIQVRLNLNDDPLTWRHIADALNAKAINERELGNTAIEYESLPTERSTITKALKASSKAVPRSHIEIGEISETEPAQPSWKFPHPIIKSTITELTCYHGALKGIDAKKLLEQQPGNSHLVRYSDSNEEYILSVLKRGANGPICQHFVIKKITICDIDVSVYTVEGSDMMFLDASEMMEYFRRKPISYQIYDGIGEPCLAMPKPCAVALNDLKEASSRAVQTEKTTSCPTMPELCAIEQPEMAPNNPKQLPEIVLEGDSHKKETLSQAVQTENTTSGIICIIL